MNSTVSIIVPTKNSADYLRTCLMSIYNQSYKNIEIIVVDNHSSDETLKIAHEYADKVYICGPERSQQRNFGAAKSRGRYLLFIDSDMKLSRFVVEDCAHYVSENSKYQAVIIPEKVRGKGFWARCLALEGDLYQYTEIESPRFFGKKVFDLVGGYNESLISGEDWEITSKIQKISKIGRINKYINHYQGPVRFGEIISKKYYYAKNILPYLKSNNSWHQDTKINPVLRMAIFLKSPNLLFADPLLGIGLIFLKLSEYCAGVCGIIFSFVGRVENK